MLIPLMSFGQNRVQNYIDRQMKTDSLLINAVVGILAVDADGHEIASWNPDMPMLTASTMKTITTGLGYEVLGPDYRFSTRIAYDGRIENGVLHGNLYIVGGADPTLGSRDTIAFPVDTVFSQWAAAVQRAGIRRIAGRIVGDDRVFEEENIPTSWSYGNIGYDYGSGTSGLSSVLMASMPSRARWPSRTSTARPPALLNLRRICTNAASAARAFPTSGRWAMTMSFPPKRTWSISARLSRPNCGRSSR